MKKILHYEEHPLNGIFNELKSSFSGRLLMPRCSTEIFRRSFIPTAVRYFNEVM